MLKLVNNYIARDKNIDEIKYNLFHLQLLKESDRIYDSYSTHVLGIEIFLMTEQEYRSALNGMPMQEGNHQHNTQILLKDKISALHHQMVNLNRRDIGLENYI